MGFGFKIAPGVKVYPSSRGLGVGLRAGPVGHYIPAGGSRRSSVSAYQRQLRAAERAQQIEAVAAADQELVRIATVHEEEFPPAGPPKAAAAEEVDSRSLRKRFEKEELKGVSLFGRSERREAKERARERAEAEAAAEAGRRETARAAAQSELDVAWKRLLVNDPDTVLASLEAAFADNESPAAAVSCRDRRVDILMRWFPIDEIVGERKFAYTPSGKPTHQKRSQKDRNQFYLEAMASNALATAKEAFAVAPNLEECALLCFRGEHDPAYGDTVLEVLYQGVLPRSALEAINWPEVSPIAALARMPEAEFGVKGKSFQIRPVDVSDDSEAAAVLGHLAKSLGWRSA